MAHWEKNIKTLTLIVIITENNSVLTEIIEKQKNAINTKNYSILN